MTTVRDKRVIVTGGANGIGFEYSRQLLLNGAKTVAILDLPGSNGQASTTKLNQEFGDKRAIFLPSDVTKHDEFELAFGNAVRSMGGLDVLVNNAGILNDAIWEKEISLNFTALVKGTLLGYDFMGKHKGAKGGIIVNVASVVGLVPVASVPVYSGTKHAVIGFTASLAEHYERTGISVRTICPGVTDTPLITAPGDRYLNFVDKERAHRDMQQLPRQRPSNVGKAITEVIEKGRNASVWISQTNDPPLEIQLKKYESVKL